MGDDQTSEDPGWPRLATILLALIPGGLQLILRRQSGNGLEVLRAVLLAFTGSVVAFGVVLALIGGPSGPIVPWLPMLALIAVASVVAVHQLVKPLDCSSPAMLASSYRTRYFLVTACSETVALFAFVFTFVGGPKWIYYVGAAFSLYRFWTVVPPTPAGIARDQERLEADGCSLSLVAALGRPPRRPSPET